MSSSAEKLLEKKKPINRKMLYLALMGVGFLGVVGLISVTVNDPRQAQVEKQEEKSRQAVAALETGSEATADGVLDEQARKIDRQISEEKKKNPELSGNPFAPEGGSGGATPAGYDPELLRLLDEAQQSAGASPSVAKNLPGGGGGSSGGGLLPPVNGASGDAGANGIMYDKYDNKGVLRAVADDMFADGGGSGGSDGKGGEQGQSATEQEFYETLKPAAAPSKYIVNQGNAIQAVLMTKIDTRIPGPITAMVTRTVYDSRTQRIPLIPQGSRLVGAYDSGVVGGQDRVAVQFERLILPDGRAFVLPAFPTSGQSGIIGLDGKYKSNIMRAIGPTFVVAVLSQALDRLSKKEIQTGESGTATPGMGGTIQSPSVIEQVAPKINEVVMKRGEGAKPYIVVAPGASLRVVVTADMEVPAAGGVR